MQPCVKCGKPIFLKKDKYTLIGTYMGKKIQQESYFHFNCWELYCKEKVNEKAKSLVQEMQQKIAPIVKEMFTRMVN